MTNKTFIEQVRELNKGKENLKDADASLEDERLMGLAPKMAAALLAVDKVLSEAKSILTVFLGRPLALSPYYDGLNDMLVTIEEAIETAGKGE